MRVLVAAEQLGTAGGMERYLDVVLPALSARGAEIRILTSDRIAWSDEHDSPNASAAEAVRRELEAFAPDIAVAHNVMDAGVVEALRSAARLAYHVHDHRPFCPNGDRVFPRTRANCRAPLGAACVAHALLDGCAYGPRPGTLALIARRRRLRDAIARADATIVASAYVRERAASSGIPVDRLVTLPLPLPDDAYGSGTVAETRSILFAGRIVPQKGLLDLIRAVARIPSAKRPVLQVLGDGPQLPEARAAAGRAGVALVAAGVAVASAVREAIDAAAFTVVPSLWAEPFGYVGIESFARGRAVVAYDSGGIAEWLRDGRNGRAVRTGDEAALADAIQTLLDDETGRRTLEQNARADAERYRAGPIVDRLLQAYRGG